MLHTSLSSLIRRCSLGLAFCLAACCCRAGDVASVDLPGLLDITDFLRDGLAPVESSAIGIGGERTVSASNNILPLRRMTDRSQPVTHFGGSHADALLEDRESFYLESGDWWVGRGYGRTDAYEGNSDAAQLWLDLRAKSMTRETYLPYAQRNMVSASWIGVGRRIPVRMLGGDGQVRLMVRRITVDDYWAGVATGSYRNDEFTGMVKTLVSETAQFRSTGEGWSLDVDARLAIGHRCRARVCVEGLIGRVSWDAITLEHRFVQSPTVFTDPDGYLRDNGGITGVWSRDHLSLRANPRYQLDMVLAGSPDLLMGVSVRKGWPSIPYVGGAWECRDSARLFHLRYFPTEGRYEIGALGRRWHARLSADSLSSASAKRVEASISASVSAF